MYLLVSLICLIELRVSTKLRLGHHVPCHAKAIILVTPPRFFGLIILLVSARRCSSDGSIRRNHIPPLRDPLLLHPRPSTFPIEPERRNRSDDRGRGESCSHQQRAVRRMRAGDGRAGYGEWSASACGVEGANEVCIDHRWNGFNARLCSERPNRKYIASHPVIVSHLFVPSSLMIRPISPPFSLLTRPTDPNTTPPPHTCSSPA